MSNAITNFQNANVPAFLASNESTMNDSLSSLATGFPTISIKGKVFTMVRDGERTVITRPDDPTAPISALMVTIVATSNGVTKTYFTSSYSEGVEDHKPMCFSNDGIRPDPSVEEPQCQSCRMCKHNAFGTARSENGGFGKGKACSDSVRLAVSPGDFGECFLLRVPPASLRALGQYSKMLSKRNIPLNAVITKISFDFEAASPKLNFDFVNFLSEDKYNQSVALGKSEQADAVVGRVSSEPAHEAPKAAPKKPAIPQAPAYITKAAAPKPAPKASPAAAPQQTTDAELAAMFEGSGDIPF